MRDLRYALEIVSSLLSSRMRFEVSNTESNTAVVSAPKPDFGKGRIADATFAQIASQQEELQSSRENLKFKWVYWLLVSVIVFSVTCVEPILDFQQLSGEWTSWAGRLSGALVVGFVVNLLALFFMRSYHRRQSGDIDYQLASAKIEQLQDSLEDDFFTKLVKINLKYLDQHNLQIKEQTDKGFYQITFVSAVSLFIIIAGIVMMFMEQTIPAYVTVSAGVLGEFVAAVFLFLYNRMLAAKGTYHQKIVIMQNIGLALKLAEELPEAERTQAQAALTKELTENVIQHLTEQRCVPSATAEAG